MSLEKGGAAMERSLQFQESVENEKQKKHTTERHTQSRVQTVQESFLCGKITYSLQSALNHPPMDAGFGLVTVLYELSAETVVR